MWVRGIRLVRGLNLICLKGISFAPLFFDHQRKVTPCQPLPTPRLEGPKNLTAAELIARYYAVVSMQTWRSPR